MSREKRNIFKRSLKYFNIRPISVLGIFTIIVTLVSICITLWQIFGNINNQGIVGLVFIGILSIFWGIEVVVNFSTTKSILKTEILNLKETLLSLERHDKYEKYAKAYSLFAEAFSSIHDFIPKKIISLPNCVVF